jgi:predicted ATPase/DNA-binding SARP family transcriptional activator
MLGPVRVLLGGAPVDLGGLRAEMLLTLLAIHPDVPVSTDALVDELWAGEPPDGAATTLRSYVSRLRTALGPAASIERVTGGYVLGVPPETTDVARFERLAREGIGLHERDRHRRAAAVLANALGFWRGEPFAGLLRDGILGVEAARLQELRLNLLERRIDADLELGRSSEVIDELEGLVAEHPFRERLWRHLMLALYRGGRQADALAAYHRARQALDEQLGIDPGTELQALEGAILRQDVPGPKGEGVRPTQEPPLSLTAFIGRRAELDEVRALLFRSRLVTLVGVGGVGKTRLAMEAARRASTDLVDAIAFADLAAVSDPELVARQALGALGVTEQPGASAGTAVARELGDMEVLLVLDNCEHVRDAAAALAVELLEAAPGVRVLATSREALGVGGEAAYAVPPLNVPVAGADEHAVRESDAVRLLVDRATLGRHGLRLDEAAYDAAARICRELEGLPLAIELAAARTKALSLEEIAVRIRDRFEFLVSWRRLTTARHRTLREAMDWSFQLLEPDEQRLLARMAVFPAGAHLESIATVCLDGDAAEAERHVERLVDASLVVPNDGPRGTRYRLLETVRQYAGEQLPEDEREPLRRRHAEHARTIAELSKLSLEGTGSAMSFDMAREELASIRAGIQWAIEADPALGAQIACALERFWTTNQLQEGIAIFTRLLEVDEIDAALRARILRCRGGCLYISGAFASGVEDYEAALAIHRRLDQRAYQAHMLVRLAAEAQRAGDPARSYALLEEADAVGAEGRFPVDAYVSRSIAADLAFDEDRVDDALALLQRSADLAADADDGWWRAGTLQRLADRALTSGRVAVAGPPAREALRWSRDIGDRQSIVYGLASLAWEATAAGRHDRAGRLWGGLQAEVERGGPVGQWELEEEVLRAQVDLGSEAFRTAVAAGRALSLDQVVEEALTAE